MAGQMTSFDDFSGIIRSLPVNRDATPPLTTFSILGIPQSDKTTFAFKAKHSFENWTTIHWLNISSSIKALKFELEEI